MFALLFSYSGRPSAHKIPSILRTQICTKICYFNQFPIQAQQTCHSREVSGRSGSNIPIFPDKFLETNGKIENKNMTENSMKLHFPGTYS